MIADFKPKFFLFLNDRVMNLNKLKDSDNYFGPIHVKMWIGLFSFPDSFIGLTINNSSLSNNMGNSLEILI